MKPCYFHKTVSVCDRVASRRRLVAGLVRDICATCDRALSRFP